MVPRRMSVSQQLQLGCLFQEVKLVIFIIFENSDKTCSKIEKTWFLLVHWVAKNNLVNEKYPEAVVRRCCQKGFLKILQNSQKSTWSPFYQSYRSQFVFM